MNEIKLRPYQREAIEAIPETGSYVICLATGLGKSVIFSRVPRRGRMLILSHRDELVHQPEKYFDCSFGVEQGKEFSNGEEIVSASVQSLVRRLDRFKPDDFDILVTDECHHATAQSYRKIYDYFKPRLHLGFTATPNRNDGVGLKDIYDDIIFERNLRWGIENNYLSPIRCLRVDIGINLNTVKILMGDYAADSLAQKMNVEKAHIAIAEAYKTYAKPPCLIFCANVAHATELAKYIPGAVAIKGGEDRSEIVKNFKKGDIPCITNCMVFTEGTDLPNIQTVIMARPTKNISLYTQAVGRATRLYPGKDSALIIDCVGAGDDMDLCTAPSLFGYSVKNVPPKLREKIQGDLFDLPKIIEQLSDTPESWIQNAYYVDLWSKENSYNLHNVNFFRLPNGALSVMDIYIPPEDNLGRIEWNGMKLPTQKVIDLVCEKLDKEYGNKRNLWDLDLIKRWKYTEATEKQRELISKIAPLFNSDNLTRYEASQILARNFSAEPPTPKQIYFLKKNGYDITGLSKFKAGKIISKIKG